MLITPTATTSLDTLCMERARRVFLVKGMQKGKQAWIYVLVNKAMQPVLEHKLGKPGLDLSAYGEVLYSGWGNEPPQYVVNQVKRDFLQ